MSLWTVKMAKMVMEIAYKYQFQTMSKIQNMKQILKWNGNGYCIQTLDQVLDLSQEKKCCSWIKKRMNLITSLKLCVRLKCGTILPMKLTNMQRQGLHKDVSKNKFCFYLLFSRFFKWLAQPHWTAFPDVFPELSTTGQVWWLALCWGRSSIGLPTFLSCLSAMHRPECLPVMNAKIHLYT